jgi:NAD(P)-dependent dehydrogenase (short-subunit alcohol dehydrogenase family)
MSYSGFDLSGRVVLVTGSARGLARAAAIAYAECGAVVACADVMAAECQATAEEIRAAGGDATAFFCDVTKRESVADLVDQVVKRYGRIDVALLAVGIAYMHNAEDASEEEWVKTINTNLLGAAFCAQAVGNQMIEQGGGAIVVVSSSASTHAIKQLVAYNASKGGVNMLVRSLALEWAIHGIRVNAVAPGYMDNVMLNTPGERENARVMREINELTPLGRPGTLAEFCGPVLFLSSDASSYVTGHVLVADGGFTIH